MILHLLIHELRSHEYNRHDFRTHARVVGGSDSRDFERAGNHYGSSRGMRAAR
jgi:hypothetical protein